MYHVRSEYERGGFGASVKASAESAAQAVAEARVRGAVRVEVRDDLGIVYSEAALADRVNLERLARIR